jgi:hypothetical protein
LADRPEAEGLVLAVKLARKREEMVGISPVVCGDASVCAGLRGQFDGGLFRRARKATARTFDIAPVDMRL